MILSYFSLASLQTSRDRHRKVTPINRGRRQGRTANDASAALCSRTLPIEPGQVAVG